MPLTNAGKKMLSEMKNSYGPEQGEKIFYATMNKHPEMKKKMEGKKK